jgi:hypothetical protein
LKSFGPLPPYKLSPIIKTNADGNFAREAISRSATLRCEEVPVPLSPIIANFKLSEAFWQRQILGCRCDECRQPECTSDHEAATDCGRMHGRTLSSHQRQAMAFGM